MAYGEHYKNLRQQNYMFAYNVVPAFLFRSDFARITAGPMGFLFFQKHWERLARIFPGEQIQSSGVLATETYRLSKGVYCLVVTMPPAVRYLEVQYLAIVFHPIVRYFVAGRSDLPGAESQSWTIRELSPSGGHRPCGKLFNNDIQEFLRHLARIIELEPEIRVAGQQEMSEHAQRVETFPAEFQMAPPEEVWVIAATYKIVSHLGGDTSGLPPAAMVQVFQQGGEKIREAVAAILCVSQPETERSPSSEPPRKWWQFWK